MIDMNISNINALIQHACWLESGPRKVHGITQCEKMGCCQAQALHGQNHAICTAKLVG